MTRGARLALLALVTAACGEVAIPEPGIGARVTLDRSRARVGDPIGVTVEVETPDGFALQTPSAPSDAAFASDSVRLVEPVRTDTGLRHHLLWVVRAREVGELALPWLEIPLLGSDGELRPLRVGGIPVSVRSVRADLPERAAVFDIRAAPAIAPTPVWVWIAVALAIAAGSTALRALRRRARALRQATTRLEATGRRALAELGDPDRDADARAAAGAMRAALLEFVAGVWGIDTSSATPAELPAAVDRELVRVLAALERARFAKRPRLEPVAELASTARERVRNVANLRA